MKNIFYTTLVMALYLVDVQGSAQIHPDQQHVINSGDSINKYIETSNNIVINETTNCIELTDNATEGYFSLKAASFEHPFNRGLPSWNGFAPSDEKASFKIEMRFEMAGGWSRWVTVGYWDKNIWPTYGYTSFTGGKVAIDYVKLDYYITNYQFKVNFKRNNTSYKSPSIEQLSFFVSDTRTTDNADIDAIVNDNPAAILITTDFVYQYGVDDVIGGSICSPSTVSMIIKSYDIDVDTYDFAVRTKDPYWEIFGVWPRIVQHAAEYGLQGSVTRYRNWDAAYQVLNNGGRIAITVGPPLYSGHLIMLAGFDNNGNPIVHDPAKSNGYSYRHNKRSLTESWFNKGGISYTFYKKENATFAGNELFVQNTMLNVYPNPIVDKATIELELKRGQAINLKIYNIQGQCIQVIKQNEYLPKGKHRIQLDFNRNFETVSGFYILNLRSRTENINVKLIKTLR